MSKPQRSIWIEHLTLTNFRNYASARLDLTPEPIVLFGANGAGKTNLLEAVSLLAPGQGLRRAPFGQLARVGGSGDWAVAARVHAPRGTVDIGTGRLPSQETDAGARTGRLVRIDGIPQSGSGALADWVEMVWLTPAMDGLFTGPASERRAFLDRLTLCFDPGYRTRAGQYERAMRQRNRLLQDGATEDALFSGLELIMAETGVAAAAARAQAAAALEATISTRRQRGPDSPFPWAKVALEGWIEERLANQPAVDVEDAYLAALRSGRERDRAAGRALIGPHRTDMLVEHGPKGMPAAVCSTGEQKALLIGLVLAHAELLAERAGGAAPVLLLDEIAAHLDVFRRAALFDELLRLGSQAWMTGTDRHAFAALENRARFLHIDEGRILEAA
ncbi:MAG TPA: DNA replication/repair protein RecF [Hyphomicrobiaceae bacterium]